MDDEKRPAEPQGTVDVAKELLLSARTAWGALADQLDALVYSIIDILRNFGVVGAVNTLGQLTPRQFHLYSHGKTRTRKKWANAARHKAELARKRGGTNNG